MVTFTVGSALIDVGVNAVSFIPHTLSTPLSSYLTSKLKVPLSTFFVLNLRLQYGKFAALSTLSCNWSLTLFRLTLQPPDGTSVKFSSLGFLCLALPLFASISEFKLIIRAIFPPVMLLLIRINKTMGRNDAFPDKKPLCLKNNDQFLMRVMPHLIRPVSYCHYTIFKNCWQ